MIVSTGKNVIRQFFGGQVGQIADTLAFGTGTADEALTDTALATEVYRVRIDSINADLDNSRIVFKATIPAGAFASFSEIALFNNGQGSGGWLGTLVARTVLDDPSTPDANLPTEIEYSLGITL